MEQITDYQCIDEQCESNKQTKRLVPVAVLGDLIYKNGRLTHEQIYVCPVCSLPLMEVVRS